MPVSATRIFYISAFNADVEFLRISIDFVSRRIDRILLLTGNKVSFLVYPFSSLPFSSAFISPFNYHHVYYSSHPFSFLSFFLRFYFFSFFFSLTYVDIYLLSSWKIYGVTISVAVYGTHGSLYFNGFVCLEGFLDRELGRVNVLSRGSVRVSHAHTNAVTRVQK